MPPPPATMESQFGHDQVMDLCINKSIVNTPLSCSDNATWNFVQMNMTLLPIARPVPVSVSHRFQEGAVLSGVKPSTPTQKLHRRLRQHTINISPRRHDLDCNAIRPTATTTSHPKSSNRGRPPTPRLTCGAKRKISETWHVPAIDAPMPPPAVSVSMRMRSFSEDLYTPATRSDCGYSSDPAGQMPLGYSPLDRSASLSYGCAAKSKGLYKGKRILELQNEDRRFHPDDRGTAPPSSKRSKHQS